MSRPVIRSARSRRYDDNAAVILRAALSKMQPLVKDSVDLEVELQFGKELPLSEILWKSTENIRERVMKTYFIDGLNDGSLNPVKFGQYVVQDAVYCYHAKDDLDIVAQRSHGEIRDFFLAESAKYKEYYEAMFKDWSIEQPTGIHLNPAAKDYVNSVADVARSKDPVYYFIASLPCLRLWPWIGKQLKKAGKNSGVYQSWVKENFAGDGYHHWEEFINKSSSVYQKTALEIFNKSMTCEFNFFDSIKA